MADSEAANTAFTVFIRLPFPRGGFVDPPAVDWDTAKDKALWKILSKASKSSDIEWNVLAQKFNVSLPFVLQQAAWLYERQLSQVRAQMRRVGASKSSAQSPVPGTESAGGEAMRKTGSGGGGTGGEAMRRTGSGGGGGPRVQSSVSTRIDSPIPRIENSISTIPSRATAPPLSRNSSANTIQGRLHPQASPRPAKASLHRLSMSPPLNQRPTPTPLELITAPLSHMKNISSSEAAESSSSDSSSDSEPAQSRLLRRPPRFSTHKMSRLNDDDDADDDDTPAFLPFSSTLDTSNGQPDPSATLREELISTNRRNTARKSMEVAQKSQNSDSSASSTAPASTPNQRGQNYPQRPPGPLSPRRTAELTGRSPIGKGKSLGREGSDGTPSMGSSFSDLDDASVTQSALEEALASNMKQGGVASRMSSISQALRSRYL